jgi:hypothetical protein
MKELRPVLLVNCGAFLRRINRRKKNMHLNLAGIISADTENVCMDAPKEVFGQRTIARTEKDRGRKFAEIADM